MLPKKRRIPKAFFGKSGPFKNQTLSFATVKVIPLSENTRVSFIVSKKVAKSATERNLLRRRGYSYIAPYLDYPKHNYGLFFYVKKEMKLMKKADITKELEGFMRGLG